VIQILPARRPALVYLALLWLVPGWAGETNPPATDAQTLPRAVADASESGFMLAEEGYLTSTQFFIKYRVGDEVRYSGGNWRRLTVLIDTPDQEGEDYTIPSILPLEYHQAEAWDELPPDARPVRIFGVERWRELRDRLLVSVLPTEEQAGVVLSFANDDYFLYYDEHGIFNATELHDKPADYRILDNFDFNEFFQRGRPILESYLAEHGIPEREFVFNTGDTGAYSLPFVYGNMEKRIAIFGRFVPESMLAGPNRTVNDKVQTAGHIGRSHLSGFVLRPISSLHRLFFAVSHTAFDTVRPDWMLTLDMQPVPPLNSGPAMDLDVWEAALDKLTGRPASTGTVKYLIGGEQFFIRFIDAIVSARESIYLRTYIFDNDDFAMKIADLLKRRSNENIDVKVLLDGLGTIFATGAASTTEPEDYAPPPSVRRYLETDSQVDVRQATNPWLAGDHVKTTIIDQKYAFIGGMNIGREYRYDWHDLMMELEGPVVNILQQEFLDNWAHAGPFGDLGFLAQQFKPDAAEVEDVGYPVRIVFTKAGSSEIFRSQVAAIRASQKYIYIQNAYFTDDTILYELAKARRRGVDVRVIIPLESDRGLLTKANAVAANALLEYGIRVYIYPGMSHIKAAVYDGWACLGSANMDRLSLRINKEANIATSDPQAVNELVDTLFMPDFERSPELTEPFPERWMDHLVETVGDYLL
jgi:cardiolipin synthase